MSKPVFSVGQFVKRLATKLQNDASLQNVLIEGEICQFTAQRSSKHWYFAVKDESSQLSCVMWSFANEHVGFIPKVGDQVQIRGNVRVYDVQGKLQFDVKGMRKMDALGDLYLKFEALKKQLNEEGLFDQAHKKQIPPYPFKIGLVTGSNTAAREDVYNTLNRRWPVASVYEVNALMQGEQSAPQIIQALKTLDPYDLDVIILARGGGSYEDLFSFNDEALARCIYAMHTPLVTGIGHEVDYTIADFVGDVRAVTPTGAAELATPNIEEVQNFLDQATSQLKQGVNATYINAKHRLSVCKENQYLKDPMRIVNDKSMTLDLLSERFLNSINSIQKEQEHKIDLYHQRIQSATMNVVERNEQSLEHLEQQLNRNVIIKQEAMEQQIMHMASYLDAISPLKVLSRGYAVVEHDNNIIKDSDDLCVDDELSIQFSKGKVKTRVTSIEKKGSSI